jgi:hypothetical protein
VFIQRIAGCNGEGMHFVLNGWKIFESFKLMWDLKNFGVNFFLFPDFLNTILGFIKKRKWVNFERHNILQLYLNSYLKIPGSEDTSNEFTVLTKCSWWNVVLPYAKKKKIKSPVCKPHL